MRVKHEMMRDNLVLICASLIVTQLIFVSSEDIDWSTVHDELRKLAANLRKKCIAESGTTVEALNGVEQGDFPDDNKLACYFKCMMEKGGVMKKDGKLNYKVLIKLVPAAYKQIGMDMVNECRETGGTEKCEIAYNFNKCMYKANPVAFFAV